MRRSLLALIASLLWGCAPATAGPDLPRPLGRSDVATTTSIAGVTTTTLDPVTLMARTCPTALCLVYEIAPGARWSNGAPVTVDDFAHTATLMADPLIDPPSDGYRLIEEVRPIDQTRFRVSLSEDFGGWEHLFDRVLPLTGDPHDVATIPTTGPFRLVEWVPGDRIVVRRDRGWWSPVDRASGLPLGTVEEVTFVFPPDEETMLDQLEEGTVDVVSLRPDADTMARLDAMEEVSYITAPGPFWEHIDFNHTDPILSQTWARQAISLAIDREQVLDRTVRLIDPGATTLDNTVWMANTVHYEDHYHLDHDPVAAAALLAANGCQPGDDGIQVCGERRLSLLWASTDDDPARLETFSLVREQLAEVGIELVAAFRSPSTFVTREFLFSGAETWQIIEFAWRAGSDPATQNQVYYCGDTELNVNRFCSEEVTELVRSTDTIADPQARAARYNQADLAYLAQAPLIPLYQKPVLMAWREGIGGPSPNWSRSGDLWNLGAWFGPPSIVIGLPSEPLHLDPLDWSDESANTVLSVLLYGALGMDPSHASTPLLVASVEMVEGEG